jgi:AcrR family transcriptional regulator
LIQTTVYGMPSSDSATRDSLLDAAEALFAKRGFARASVRAITDAAGANVASVNYHFGSKLELIKAVLARRVGPLNVERLRRLEACEASGEASLESVLAAFIEPAIAWTRSERDRATLAQLLGLSFSQPSPEVRAVMLDLFGPVVDRFVPALMRLLPGISREQAFWRFHFLIGATVFTVALGSMAETYSGGACDPGDAGGTAKELVSFLAAGFRHDQGLAP